MTLNVSFDTDALSSLNATKNTIQNLADGKFIEEAQESLNNLKGFPNLAVEFPLDLPSLESLVPPIPAITNGVEGIAINNNDTPDPKTVRIYCDESDTLTFEVAGVGKWVIPKTMPSTSVTFQSS